MIDNSFPDVVTCAIGEETGTSIRELAKNASTVGLAPTREHAASLPLSSAEASHLSPDRGNADHNQNAERRD